MKTGLALGGGGYLGFTHLGFLKVLDDNGLKPDIIAGTSAGAIVGSLYANGLKPEELLEFKERFSFLKLMHFDFPFDGLSSSQGLRNALEPLLNKVKFNQLKIKLLVTATDLIKGELKVFDKGSVLDAVIASSSVPGLFNPFKNNNQLLVDGYYTSPVPVSPLKDKGVKKVISISFDNLKPLKNNKRLSALTVMNRSVEVQTRKLKEWEESESDLVIRVPAENFNMLSIKDREINHLFNLGVKTAKKHLKSIKKILK